jgi:hypothetical protein
MGSGDSTIGGSSAEFGDLGQAIRTGKQLSKSSTEKRNPSS